MIQRSSARPHHQQGLSVVEVLFIVVVFAALPLGFLAFTQHEELTSHSRSAEPIAVQLEGQTPFVNRALDVTKACLAHAKGEKPSEPLNGSSWSSCEQQGEESLASNQHVQAIPEFKKAVASLDPTLSTGAHP